MLLSAPIIRWGAPSLGILALPTMPSRGVLGVIPIARGWQTTHLLHAILTTCPYPSIFTMMLLCLSGWGGHGPFPLLSYDGQSAEGTPETTFLGFFALCFFLNKITNIHFGLLLNLLETL